MADFDRNMGVLGPACRIDLSGSGPYRLWAVKLKLSINSYELYDILMDFLLTRECRHGKGFAGSFFCIGNGVAQLTMEAIFRNSRNEAFGGTAMFLSQAFLLARGQGKSRVIGRWKTAVPLQADSRVAQGKWLFRVLRLNGVKWP